MPNDFFVALEGDEEIMHELERLEAAVDPRRGLADTTALATGMLHRYSTGIVHVDTGRLKNSLFWETGGGGNSVWGRVATNVAYAPFEERRGGQHAFFGRTVREETPHINDLFGNQIEVRIG